MPRGTGLQRGGIILAALYRSQPINELGRIVDRLLTDEFRRHLDLADSLSRDDECPLACRVAAQWHCSAGDSRNEFLFEVEESGPCERSGVQYSAPTEAHRSRVSFRLVAL
jgi:hypothetical protein